MEDEDGAPLQGAEVPSLGRAIRGDNDFVALNKMLRACHVCRLVKTERQVGPREGAGGARAQRSVARPCGSPHRGPPSSPAPFAPAAPAVRGGGLRQLPLPADGRRPRRRGQPDDAQLYGVRAPQGPRAVAGRRLRLGRAVPACAAAPAWPSGIGGRASTRVS
jgi:hypothetical protein